MIGGIFTNMAFLISYISIGAQLLRKYDSLRQDGKKPSVWYRVFFGAFTGCMGITLILFSVKAAPGVIVDFRYIAVIVSSVFGGVVSALVCSVAVALFRLLYGGMGYSSAVGALAVLATAVGCIIVSKAHLKISRKWVISTAVALVVSCLCFMMLIPEDGGLFLILTVHSGFTILISIFSFYYIRYVLAANALYYKLQYESTRDFLTGLNNVRRFDDLYNIAIRNAQEQREKLSLLLIDIDFFKNVNDRYGHKNGDAVLAQLGRILEHGSGKQGTVSRNGGEEFTVILRSCDGAQAVAAAEQLRSEVENSRFTLTDGQTIPITVSIGVACFPDSAEANKLIERADMALYQAKRTGRNKVALV